MCSINQTMEIKQEVEKDDEFDQTASIQSEISYPRYEPQCDSIKIKEEPVNKQNVSDLTVKHERIWMQASDEAFEAELREVKHENSAHHYVDPAHIADESDCKIKSMSPTCDSMLHRVKTEPTAEYEDEAFLTPDVCQVKVENSSAIEYNSEKLDGMKHEDLDALQLNAELDIKCEIDTTTIADAALDSAAKNKKGEKGAKVDGAKPERALFICYNCNYTSSTKKRLIQHISVGCCDLSANSAKSRLAYKRQNPSNDYVCTQCSIGFARKLNLDEHIIRKHRESIGSVSSKIHDCTQCDYKTTMKVYLDRHMSAHSKAVGLSICKCCNASFKSERTLDNHVIKKHPRFVASLGKKIHECSNCTYKTTNLKYLTDHLKVHSKDKVKTCEHCNATFKRQLSLDDHIVRKHPHLCDSVSIWIHQCPSCDYISSRKKDIDKHMLKKHIDVSDNLVICKRCNSRHKSEQALNNHIIKEHPDFMGSVTRKIHECSNCSYKTTTLKYFKKHMRIHFGDKVNACDHCEATFKYKVSLDDHIVRKHPQFSASVSYSQCPSCDYKSARKHDVDKHMLTHQVADPIICNHCDGRFKSEQGLNNHIIEQHPLSIASVTRKIYECLYCPFKTTYKKSFNVHTARHSDVAPKLNECKHCAATFTCKYYLDDHIVKQHPDFIASVKSKIHGCSYCAYKTVRKDALEKHTAYHHRNEVQSVGSTK